MRTVFFGTPAWAVPSLEALLASDHEVLAAVTNPDKPAGRGMETVPPPVKVAASKAGLAVEQPPRARDPELRTWLEDLAPDVAVVVAYGKILPGELLAVPRLGFVNVHFSVLPHYRGAAPVQRAVMDGVAETGVSIMVLTEGMDEGPVLAVTTTPIADDDTAGSVGERLATMGAELLVPTLSGYGSGDLAPVEQDHASASYAPKITPADARIDWSRPARSVFDFVRGLNPVPGAWTTLEGRRLKVFSVAPRPEEGLAPGARPDEVLAPGALQISRDGIVAGTGEGALELVEVQPEGKRRMAGAEFGRGLRPNGPRTLE